MGRSFLNIQEYRKEYYRKNKNYLLSYQKWYYTNRRFQAGLIDKSFVYPKPDKNERYTVKEKKMQNSLIIEKGNFTITFD